MLEAANGGSEIVSYELSIYNQTLEQWQSIQGGEDQFSLLNEAVYEQGIEKGTTYQLRYRAWNINGPGQFSETGYVQAAQVPERQIAPVYVSSTADSISLGFSPSVDDGGSIITQIVLEISPYLSSDWQTVDTYSDNTMSHTLTVTDDGLVPYAEYRFRMKSVNAYGDSKYSPELAVSVAPLPSALDPVTKVQSLSTITSIMVAWTPPVADIEPIVGYQLFMQDMQDGSKSLVYDGAKNPNTEKYYIDHLE